MPAAIIATAIVARVDRVIASFFPPDPSDLRLAFSYCFDF
jgi:hypothetical protein